MVLTLNKIWHHITLNWRECRIGKTLDVIRDGCSTWSMGIMTKLLNSNGSAPSPVGRDAASNTTVAGSTSGLDIWSASP